MVKPAVPAALSILFLAAVAAPGGLAAAGDYCVDRSCPYYGMPVDLHVLIDHPVFPDREAEGTCYPVEGTGERPAVRVYPVLNMVVINNCIFRDGVFEDGPLVGTVRKDAHYETPASVIVSEGEEEGVEAERVACVPAGSSSSGPRVQVYSGMSMYDLDACSIDWSSASSGRLQAYLTVSPAGA